MSNESKARQANAWGCLVEQLRENSKKWSLKQMGEYAELDFCKGWDARDEEVADLKDQLKGCKDIDKEVFDDMIKASRDRDALKAEVERLREPVLTITDGPLMVENITIDARYKLTKERDRWREMAGKLADEIKSLGDGICRPISMTEAEAMLHKIEVRFVLALAEFEEMKKELGE